MEPLGQEPTVAGAESPLPSEMPPLRQKYTQPDLRVMVFKMAGHEYVLDVALVQEIVRPTDPSIDLRTGLMHVDSAPEYVEGVIKRRGRIVPVVDLRRRLSLSASPPTVETCVIVTRLPIGPVGFLVDSVLELMWVKTHDFQVPSPVIAGIDQVYLQGVAHLGDRLLVMLDLEQLLTPHEQRELSELGGLVLAGSPWKAETESPPETLFSGELDAGEGETEEEQVQVRANLRNLVVFELGDELYGVPAADVAEIREPLALMPLPNVPSHVLGLINLRGIVMPVIDLRRKFGLDLKPDRRHNRLMILKALRRTQGEGPGYPVALRVDAVRDLARLSQADFQPAPSGVAAIDPEYYDQVATLDGRMLIELNVQKLLTGTAAVAEDPCPGPAEFT
jgi:purine-binding chemotaxis protein CheW